LSQKNKSTCKCIIEKTNLGPIVLEKSEINIAPLTIIAGPHAVGKSTIAFNIAKQLGNLKSSYRYREINSMRCNCVPHREFMTMVIPAERVLIPYYNTICGNVRELDEFLEHENKSLRDIVSEPSSLKPLEDIYDISKKLCEYLGYITPGGVIDAPPYFSYEIYDIVKEASRNIFENIYEVLKFLEYVKENIDIDTFQRHYGIPYEIVRGDSGVYGVDTRAKAVQKLSEVSLGIAPASVVYGLLNAARSSFWEHTLLLVEEPEEEAHPYAQYYIGYILAYVTIKVNKLAEKGEAKTLTTIITTHSPYILSGVYSAVDDIGKKEKEEIPLPHVYTVDYETMARNKPPTVVVQEWEPRRGVIPGFFAAEKPIIIPSLRIAELYEKYKKGVEGKNPIKIKSENK